MRHLTVYNDCFECLSAPSRMLGAHSTFGCVPWDYVGGVKRLWLDFMAFKRYVRKYIICEDGGGNFPNRLHTERTYNVMLQLFLTIFLILHAKKTELSSVTGFISEYVCQSRDLRSYTRSNDAVALAIKI